MNDAKWVCLTDAEYDERAPILVRYDLISVVDSNDDTARIWTSANDTHFEVKEGLKEVFLAPVCDTPLMALKKWEENA